MTPHHFSDPNLCAIVPFSRIDSTFEFEESLTMELSLLKLPIILVFAMPLKNPFSIFLSFLEIPFIFRSTFQIFDSFLGNYLMTRAIHVAIFPAPIPDIAFIDVFSLPLDNVVFKMTFISASIRIGLFPFSMFFALLKLPLIIIIVYLLSSVAMRKPILPLPLIHIRTL